MPGKITKAAARDVAEYVRRCGSQRVAADRLRVHQSTVSRWAGMISPVPGHVRRLVKESNARAAKWRPRDYPGNRD